MSVTKTTDLNLGNFIGKEIFSKPIQSGVLSKLTGALPELKIGSTDFFTFNGSPKAELVGEGENKSSTNEIPAKVTAKTYKVQVTYRVSDEVKFTDEQEQIGIIEALIPRVATALSRALDLVAIHGINPLTGTVSSNVTQYFDKSGVLPVGNIITATADPVADLDSANDAILNGGYTATGIAMDPKFVALLSKQRTTAGAKKYPELGFGANITNFEGLMAASSNTVSGSAELTKPLVQAIMGDFENSFAWGIAKNIPLKTIEYGDPDGQGDLQRNNQIAIRAESYFGYVIADGSAFSMIKKASV